MRLLAILAVNDPAINRRGIKRMLWRATQMKTIIYEIAKMLSSMVKDVILDSPDAQYDSSGDLVKGYRIIVSAAKAAIKGEDVYICPVCKSELIERKCPKGHVIIW